MAKKRTAFEDALVSRNGLEWREPTPDAGVLVFRAGLAQPGSGRKAWTQDSEGQGVLSIEVPMTDADDLGGRLALLRAKTFRIAIILDDRTTLDLPPED